MSIIYQLSAKGDSVNGHRFKMNSKKLFRTKELAEANKSEFFDKCCDENHFDYASPETLEIYVIELELVEDDGVIATGRIPMYDDKSIGIEHTIQNMKLVNTNESYSKYGNFMEFVVSDDALLPPIIK